MKRTAVGSDISDNKRIAVSVSVPYVNESYQQGARTAWLEPQDA